MEKMMLYVEDYLWENLANLEIRAEKRLTSKLLPFRDPIEGCYNAALLIPNLHSTRHHKKDIEIANLFMKRVLNDLRSIWILCLKGYTSPAASVAAALFENALAATYFAGSPENLRKIETTEGHRLPKPIDLVKEFARRVEQVCKASGRFFDDLDYQICWREAYAQYKFLCQIKHPTIKSVIHDSYSTKTSNGKYAFAAAPDVTDANLTIKSSILFISINRTSLALDQIFRGLNCKFDNELANNFQIKLQKSQKFAETAFRQLCKQEIPFGIEDDKFQNETMTLLEKRKYRDENLNRFP